MKIKFNKLNPTNIIQSILFVGGLFLIGFYSNWQTALGVFTFVWSNNFDYKDKK
jgi:hypothetical protein